MKIDYAYFLKEYHAFRKIMCSTKYSFEQKTEAHEGLLRVYILVECDNEADRLSVINILNAVDAEFAVRMSHELFRGANNADKS